MEMEKKCGDLKFYVIFLSISSTFWLFHVGILDNARVRRAAIEACSECGGFVN